MNLAAFLAMIRFSEGTAKYPDPYRVCFGGKHTIADLSNHPAVTGEWMGESLAFLGSQYAHSISTAAGAYQITRPTWLGCQAILQLANFGPDAQDRAATLLIQQKGALDLVNGGEVQTAICKCAGIWASLPGSTSGQPQRNLAELVSTYAGAGGGFA